MVNSPLFKGLNCLLYVRNYIWNIFQPLFRITASSAYNVPPFPFPSFSNMSFMVRVNRSGLNTLPWGIQFSTQLSSSTLTLKARCNRRQETVVILKLQSISLFELKIDTIYIIRAWIRFPKRVCGLSWISTYNNTCLYRSWLVLVHL